MARFPQRARLKKMVNTENVPHGETTTGKLSTFYICKIRLRGVQKLIQRRNSLKWRFVEKNIMPECKKKERKVPLEREPRKNYQLLSSSIIRSRGVQNTYATTFCRKIG
jgi:hypothetical protein